MLVSVIRVPFFPWRSTLLFGAIIPLMSKLTRHMPKPPFRTWTITVDDKNRVRLPREEVAVVVPWTAAESGPIECVAMPGAVGGMQVVPVNVYEEEAEPIASGLK